MTITIKVKGSKIRSDSLLQVQCSQIKTCIRPQNNIPASNKNVKQIHQVFYLTDQLHDVIYCSLSKLGRKVRHRLIENNSSKGNSDQNIPILPIIQLILFECKNVIIGPDHLNDAEVSFCKHDIHHFCSCCKQTDKRHRKRSKVRVKCQRRCLDIIVTLPWSRSKIGVKVKDWGQGHILRSNIWCAGVNIRDLACQMQKRAISSKFGAKKGHYQSKVFVCLSVIRMQMWMQLISFSYCCKERRKEVI